jgi:hypothetical protein
MSLLVPRFPALRDGPSDPILFVGLKSSKYSKYSSGVKLGPAATLNQNPIFEIASSVNLYFNMILNGYSIYTCFFVYIMNL